jgi:hypothetical protein
MTNAASRVRNVDPVTSEVEYNQDDIEWMEACRHYMSRNQRRLPTFKELLQIARGLGYSKAIPPPPQEFADIKPPRDFHLVNISWAREV